MWHDAQRIAQVLAGKPDAGASPKPVWDAAIDWLCQNANNHSCLAVLDELYQMLDERIAAASPECANCGNCCDFERFGHRLYVTTLEMLYFFRGRGRPPEPPPETRPGQFHQSMPIPTPQLRLCHAIDQADRMSNLLLQRPAQRISTGFDRAGCGTPKKPTPRVCRRVLLRRSACLAPKARPRNRTGFWSLTALRPTRIIQTLAGTVTAALRAVIVPAGVVWPPRGIYLAGRRAESIRPAIA